jgi:hypothetical protein
MKVYSPNDLIYRGTLVQNNLKGKNKYTSTFRKTRKNCRHHEAEAAYN